LLGFLPCTCSTSLGKIPAWGAEDLKKKRKKIKQKIKNKQNVVLSAPVRESWRIGME